MAYSEVQTRISAKATFVATDKPLHVQRKVLDSDFFPHDHDFIETALIVEGEGYHCTRHGERLLKPGDLIVIAPGVWHAYRVPKLLTVYNCCFGLSMLSRELTAVYQNNALRRIFTSGECFLDLGSILMSHVEPASFRRCIRSLRRMEMILEAGNSGDRYVEQIGHLLLYLSEVSPYLVGSDTFVEKTSSSVHPAVIHCRTLLLEKFARDWTLSSLADEIHIAPKYLVRIFHESTGLAPMAYLARTRSERASLLLVNTSMPIAEIGEKVGWPDPNYFARRFRSMFGMSATEYRDRFTRQHGLAEPEDGSAPAITAG